MQLSSILALALLPMGILANPVPQPDEVAEPAQLFKRTVQTCSIIRSAVNCRRGPSTSSGVKTKLAKGEQHKFGCVLKGSASPLTDLATEQIDGIGDESPHAAAPADRSKTRTRRCVSHSFGIVTTCFMMSDPKNSIYVINNSGRQQSYALFNDLPRLFGEADAEIWTSVLAVCTVPNGSQNEFTIEKQCYAFVGASNTAVSSGVTGGVRGQRKVILGIKALDETITYGTTLQMDVVEGAPQFLPEELPKAAQPGAFEIRTADSTDENNFTFENAKANNWIIGLGGFTDGVKIGPPAAYLVPKPGISYQIQPSNTYYVCVGKSETGQAMNGADSSLKVIKLDFAMGTRELIVVHDQENNLVTQL
ncbi:unnamed protein product [Parascedosporium putredinis]|uniref:Uncharacterized protein n=1 Tax=Parascedosporium putredinis TaxID=1442378 RepID=A0A9P1MC50_9PEZI|nr:unnamed protein product [Parascedosporium putredinis]CAI7997023.1 unnamed protein product [Parascedosporium putredinis]